MSIDSKNKLQRKADALLCSSYWPVKTKTTPADRTHERLLFDCPQGIERLVESFV
jgi:hypothetical protein